MDGIEIKVGKVTGDAVHYTVSVPPLRIVDTSNWPEFTVEWMGNLMKGKWIDANCVQMGDKLIFRDHLEAK